MSLMILEILFQGSNLFIMKYLLLFIKPSLDAFFAFGVEKSNSFPLLFFEEFYQQRSSSTLYELLQMRYSYKCLYQY